MTTPKQLSLFHISSDTKNSFSGRDLGTFKDSMRAPIHRWFRYPAGYSHKFVTETIDLFGVKQGGWVYDPFSGTGTTLLVAKQQGIHGYGVEAHSFVHWVAGVKLCWEFGFHRFEREIHKLLGHLRAEINTHQHDTDVSGVFPELVYKCYHPQDLTVLYLLRQSIQVIEDEQINNFLSLALTDTLRGAAAAGTGWPYISPRKAQNVQHPKDAFKVFSETVQMMLSDLGKVQAVNSNAQIHNVLGDSRHKQSGLADEQIDLAITSPPYLNNYDYADRTRLETYFWGITKTWADITEAYRTKLMTAATTQIRRSQYDVETALSQAIQQADTTTYQTIQQAVLDLAALRKTKGGKKDYDLMVALYFNDIFAVLQEAHRVIRKGGRFCLVLGDSAPYGVHIATDDLIGKLGLAIGFGEYDYYQLRTRGGKWKKNPQRHSVPLREGIVILSK